MNTGEEIKRYIAAKGISQTFLSNKTGIRLQKLNLSLNGNRRLTFDEYARICWALGVSPGQFIRPHPPNEERGEYEIG